MNVRRPVALALAALVAAAGLAAAPAGASRVHVPVRCSDRIDGARMLELRVKGERAIGRYAAPRSKPKALVVFAHGYGHTSASWVGHMRRAARHGVLAVAMDYRGLQIRRDTNGDGLPESRGWDVKAGAEDSIAAARVFDTWCPSIEQVVMFGVSMGANTAGLAVAMSKGIERTDGKPLFDYWFDVEGAVNVIETYLAARAVARTGNQTAVNAVEDIERETGGPIEEHHEAYLERAVVTRIDDIKESGIRGAVVVHGLDDGLVPYNQGREMAALLAEAQIPTDMFTVGRRSPESERETTISGYVVPLVKPDWTSPLAGHASEKSTTHIVMTLSFERLWALLDDGVSPGPYREFLVDGELGTFPDPDA